jgi:3-deoxy-7-phosphoheptulonate synthase
MSSIVLPSPYALKKQLLLSSEASTFITRSREIAKRIIRGQDLKKALIIGPCSIHDRESALDYAHHFKAVAQSVKHSCFMVMRVYIEKSRTAKGWKGFLYDPHLDGRQDIKTGLLWTRELLLTLAEMQIPAAAEFVDPLAALYFEDLISWGFIGARTSASPPHRQFASARAMPIGFKNSTDGNLENAIHAVLSAIHPQTLLQIDEQGKLGITHSQGNPESHIVLRGAKDFTNYGPDSINSALEMLKKIGLPGRLMVDCSHGNCQKNHKKQSEVFLSVLEQIEKGNHHIFGLMLESHLKSGNQSLSENPSLLKYAVSITDPCLDWKTTEELVYSADSLFSTLVVS